MNMKTARKLKLIRSSSLDLKNHNKRVLESSDRVIELPPDVTDEEIRLAHESGCHSIHILDEK